MAPKIPLRTPRSLTSALYLAFKTAASPSRPLSSSNPAISRPHNTTFNRNISTAMGRSGYDTTNMKSAARPRPAAKDSAATGDGKKTNAKQTAAPASQQQQGKGGDNSGATASAQGSEKKFGKFKKYRRWLFPGVDMCSMSRAESRLTKKIKFNLTDPFSPKIPTGRKVEGDLVDDLPLPSLIGRGWTFWL